MPTYDLSLVIKHALKRPELVAAVKRTGEDIIKNGGYIRNLEFLGHRNLPQIQRANNEVHTKGSYFLMRVDLPTKGIPLVSDFAKRDTDVIRYDFVNPRKETEPQCTLEDELKPPSERPSVQAMINLGRKKPRFTRQFEHKTGLGFYPLYT